MTTVQKVLKYLAMAFAIFLTVAIISGILGAVGLFGAIFDGDPVTGELKTYPVTSDINKLAVEINAADLAIKQGESFLVESNLKNLIVTEENGILSIRETKKFGGTYTDAVLTLYIPADTVFEKADITTGAGKMTVEHLSAVTINLELGAGEVTIGRLVATANADIDGGAGKITVSDGALHDLDLDMGVGQLSLTGALTGKCEFDLGIGQTDITVLGNKDDYKLDIEKGIGDIQVDGVGVSNLTGQGSGSHIIEISGGVGAIRLNFRNAGKTA